MLTAVEVEQPKKTLHTKPVFIWGVMQDALKELTAPCDVLINGVTLRLPVGTVIGLTGGGSSGAHGTLQCDLEFRGRNGQTYRASKGMSLLVPAG